MPHLTRDGVKLYYEDAGSGDPALVFVHGWCCDRSYFEPQVARFTRRHRCIAVDLRGHGLSDKPADGYTVPGFADDLAFLCAALGLRRPVIVGHSMGAAVALSLAARHPDAVRAIAMLDGAILYPDATAALLRAVEPVLRAPGYVEPFRQMLGVMFMPTDDPARRDRIIAAMSAVPQHVALAELQALLSYDGAADAAACKTLALYVGSHAPVADMARLRALMPHVIPGQTAGAGHFHQLEVPDQVNAMIERFLSLVP